MAYERVDALMAEFATAVGGEAPQPQADVGYMLEVREGISVAVFGLDEERMLLMTSLGPMPDDPPTALASYLLRKNMFDSDISPFQIGLQETGDLVLWGSLAIESLTVERLAAVFDAIAEQVTRLLEALGGSRRS